jgi:hypothetical protein
MSDLTPNIPEVVAEVRDRFERYERGLVENDVAVLDDTFWMSPYTIRLAPTEHGYGFGFSARSNAVGCPAGRSAGLVPSRTE